MSCEGGGGNRVEGSSIVLNMLKLSKLVSKDKQCGLEQKEQLPIRTVLRQEATSALNIKY